MKINFDNDLYELIQGKRGYFLANKYDHFIGRALIEYGEFAELQWQLFEQSIGKGAYIIDAGANIGGHTVSFAKAAGPHGKVWAYEPQPVVFQVMCANLALNGLTNVRAYNAGCGKENSAIEIPNIDYKRKSNYGAFSLTNLPKIEGTKVPIFKLDDHYPENRLNFFKIDVEGMELEVLKGAENLIRQCKPVIYTENDRKDKSEELISFLFDLGYKAWWHRPPLFNPNNHAKATKNVFGNTVTTNMLCIHESRGTAVKGLDAIHTPRDTIEGLIEKKIRAARG